MENLGPNREDESPENRSHECVLMWSFLLLLPSSPSFCTSLPTHAPSSHGLIALQRTLAYNEVPMPPLWCEFSIFCHQHTHTNTDRHTHTFSFSFVVPRTQQGKTMNSYIWIRSYPRDRCVSNVIYWVKPQLLWCSIHESKFIRNNKPDV